MYSKKRHEMVLLYLHTMNLENCNNAVVNEHACHVRTRLSSWLLRLTGCFIKHLLFEYNVILCAFDLVRRLMMFMILRSYFWLTGPVPSQPKEKWLWWEGLLYGGQYGKPEMQHVLIRKCLMILHQLSSIFAVISPTGKSCRQTWKQEALSSLWRRSGRWCGRSTTEAMDGPYGSQNHGWMISTTPPSCFLSSLSDNLSSLLYKACSSLCVSAKRPCLKVLKKLLRVSWFSGPAQLPES